MLTGTSVSHYQILEKLGEGGMGVVYKAEDTRLKRTVALKFLPPALTMDAEAKERFIQEAQAASALEHPNICNIHEINETEDGRLYIVMACYEGQTLKDRLVGGALSIEEAVHIAGQIAEGLADAHQKGIIHRDLKPANIMLTEKGQVKIMDFGLAKLAGEAHLTRTGSIIGTAAYMSPEQARGEEVDQRTDIWSLGIVLFEMLTGKLPFAAEYDQAMIYSVLNEEPAPLCHVRRDVPEYLAALCRRCLQKDLSHRPQSMADVLRMLEERHTGSDRTVFTVPGRWRKAGAAMIVFLSLLLVIVLWRDGRYFLRPTASKPTSLRIAVLPFQDRTEQKQNDLPMIVQTLIVGELLGVENLKIIDPLSLNDMMERSVAGSELRRGTPVHQALRDLDVMFVITGFIVKSADGYLMQSSITDLLNSEIIFTNSVTMEDADDVLRAVASQAQKIVYCFQIKVLSYDEKEKDLKPWLEHGSRNLAAVKALIQANLYNYRRESALAQASLQRAIELDSNFISPRIWLVSKLMEEGKRSEAFRHYQRLVTLGSRASPFEQVMINWAGACIANDIALQARYLALAVDFSPHNTILLYSLARLRYLLTDYQGSLDALADLVKMKIRFSSAYYLLAANYYQLQKPEKAREALNQALACKPVEPNAYILFFRLSMGNADSAQAPYYEEMYLYSSKEQGRPLGSVYANLAMTNHAFKRYDPAIRYFRLAIAAESSCAAHHKGLADAFYDKGRLKEATDEYFTVLRLQPNSADAHYRLGQIFEQNNAVSDAIFHFRKYLQQDSLSATAVLVKRHLSQLQP